MNGCVVCKLAIAAKATISQYTAATDQLDSFKLALHWNRWIGKAGSFTSIEVTLLNPTNNIISTRGDVDRIRLVLDDGIPSIYTLTS